MTYLEKQFWQEFGPNPLNQLIMPVNTQCKHMEVNGRATKRRRGDRIREETMEKKREGTTIRHEWNGDRGDV